MVTKRDGVIRYMESVHIGKGPQICEHADVSRSYLDNLVRKGDLQKVGKGIYASPTADVSPYRSFAEVAVAIPNAVIALVSALNFHGIGTQLPWAVWIAVPTQTRSYVPTSVYTPIESVRMDQDLLFDGLEEHQIDGVIVRIHSIEKAIADCFKYAGRVGLSVALEALKDAWGQNKLDMDKLYDYAQRNRVWDKMRSYIEMLQQQ